MTMNKTAQKSRATDSTCFGNLTLLAKARTGLACLLLTSAALPLAAQFRGEPTTALPGHVPGLVRTATVRPRDSRAATEQITFTVLLNLADPAGFEAFSQSLHDPNSPNFRHPIGASEITARFGPTQAAYNTVRAFLEQSGFTLVTGSENRRTLTFRGTRAQAEAAFQVAIDDYQLGSRTFRAAAQDPAVPASLAPFIAGVSGLSNLGQLRSHAKPNPQIPASTATAYNGTLTPAGSTNSGGLPPGLNGAGQTIGLLEIDNYANSDLSNTLAFSGLPAGLIHQVSRFAINGGTSISGCPPTQGGCGTTESLLDIVAVLGSAPGANVIVFNTSTSTDIYDMVNAAINQVNSVTGGLGGIISASLGLCETEISSSDATGIDGLLKTAAASGLTLFAATGDSGSTCTDGSGNTFANTINYPAGVPHAVAVGGTNLEVNSSNKYSSEDWWTGGGYGISTLFSEPSFQSKLYPSAGGRSVPDVSAESTPGIVVCQATTKNPAGCYFVAGTSLATPLWAGYWALVNQAWVDAAGTAGGPSGADGYLYYYPKAYHDAASMGSDFAHVGLGSPDVTSLVAMASPGYSQVNSVSPDSGKGSGDTTVTIKGVGFIGVTKVTFGGVDAKNVTIHSDSKLTADSPAAGADQATVKVETPADRTISTIGDTFSYVPEVNKVEPNSGPFYGGTSVTVTGFALNDKYTFKFGGTEATKVNCSGSTKCTMVTPKHSDGKVDVKVEATVGNSSTPDLYNYQGVSISSFSPEVGPTVAPGVPVTIIGVSLKNGMTVAFGDKNVTASSCYLSTNCSVTSPPHAVGAVPLTVTVDGVTSAAASDQFNFKVFPTITGISPSVVPFNTRTVAANATLTITGTGFTTTGTSFNLGLSTELGSVTCNSLGTQCTAVISVPPTIKTLASAPVTVTVGGLTSLDSVGLSYPAAKPPPPHCKGTTCQ